MHYVFQKNVSCTSTTYDSLPRVRAHRAKLRGTQFPNSVPTVRTQRTDFECSDGYGLKRVDGMHVQGRIVGALYYV